VEIVIGVINWYNNILVNTAVKASLYSDRLYMAEEMSKVTVSLGMCKSTDTLILQLHIHL
jgi:hypothetical protein